jgi:hypothetical protein
LSAKRLELVTNQGKSQLQGSTVKITTVQNYRGRFKRWMRNYSISNSCILLDNCWKISKNRTNFKSWLYCNYLPLSFNFLCRQKCALWQSWQLRLVESKCLAKHFETFLF